MEDHSSVERPLAVITGASAGIGAALALRLGEAGWRLRLILRPSPHAEKLMQRLTEMRADVRMIPADIADRVQLAEAVARLSEAAEGIDVLFNNAGVMQRDLAFSPQGNEMHAEINLLAPYLLMIGLKPLLAERRGIVINTSSQALRFGHASHFPSLLHLPKSGGLFGAYADSKLALTTLTFALEEAFGAEHIRLRSVHPGVLKTQMTTGDGMPLWLRLLGPLTYGTPERGAGRLLDAADPLKHGEPQAIHLVGQRKAWTPRTVRDPEYQRRILEICRSACAL